MGSRKKQMCRNAMSGHTDAEPHSLKASNDMGASMCKSTAKVQPQLTFLVSAQRTSVCVCFNCLPPPPIPPSIARALRLRGPSRGVATTGHAERTTIGSATLAHWLERLSSSHVRQPCGVDLRLSFWNFQGTGGRRRTGSLRTRSLQKRLRSWSEERAPTLQLPQCVFSKGLGICSVSNLRVAKVGVFVRCRAYLFSRQCFHDLPIAFSKHPKQLQRQ